MIRTTSLQLHGGPTGRKGCLKPGEERLQAGREEARGGETFSAPGDLEPQKTTENHSKSEQVEEKNDFILLNINYKNLFFKGGRVCIQNTGINYEIFLPQNPRFSPRFKPSLHVSYESSF